MSEASASPRPAKYRVGMGQIIVEGGKPSDNLDRARAAIAEAAERACRLIVLPECLDIGWTDPSARTLAQPIPGPHTALLAEAAVEHRIWVAAGLVERSGDRLYNAAVLISPSGKIVLHHRKINELSIGLELYSVGDRLQVAETELGVIGLNICADNFPDSLAIGHVMGRMGAQVILSPSAWAVPPDWDASQPYGEMWIRSFRELATENNATIIGVSNVGRLTAGPWQGHSAIGNSLAVGPGGEVLARGPFGEDASTLMVVEVGPQLSPRKPSE